MAELCSTEELGRKGTVDEKRAMCEMWQETEYDINTPITSRLYFVEGAGQLCSECWRSLYESRNAFEAELSDKGTGDN